MRSWECWERRHWLLPLPPPRAASYLKQIPKQTNQTNPTNKRTDWLHSLSYLQQQFISGLSEWISMSISMAFLEGFLEGFLVDF